MFCNQEGVLPGSDFYFFTPSIMAKEQLFYFTSLGHFFCDLGYRVERREDYGNYLLFLVKRGKMVVSAKGQESIVREGELAILNCHKPHGYWAAGPAEFLWVHFEGSNSGQFYRDIISKFGGRNVFRVDNTEKIEDRLREIILNCRYRKFCTEFDDSLNIYGLLIEIYRNMPGNKQMADESEERIIDDALRFIRDNLSMELTVGMVAEHVGLSESHFSRKFRKAMNSSPKEYIIRRRMNEAKRMLKTTAYTVKEIAFLVGFNSESHFVNTFTAQNGLPPKKFREFPI